jgi:hypothetical protein
MIKNFDTKGDTKMANFSYAQYQEAVARAQQNSGTGTKVGFFKLKDDGDEALVRLNISSVEDLDFASVHTISTDGKWIKVSCLNPLGSYGESCPLCSSATAGNKAISKAGKKVYVQMLAAYKNKSTGQFENPTPVIWERPAAFSKDIAQLIKDYGNLKETIFKVTRNGAAGDMKTTYSIGFIPLYNRPELVPADGLSAFEGFNIARHSYWEKSNEEILTFIQTGKFPEVVKTQTTTTPVTTAPVYSEQPSVAPQVNPAFTAPVTAQPVVTESAPVRAAGNAFAQPETGAERPQRTFGQGFGTETPATNNPMKFSF